MANNFVDSLGQTINIGDYVAGLNPANTTPEIYKIVDFTTKKVRLKIFGSSTTTIKYPFDLFKVDTELAKKTLYKNITDSLGQQLIIGDYVLTGDNYIDPIYYEVIKFDDGKVILNGIYSPTRTYLHKGLRRAGSDLIKVDPTLITIHILRDSK